MRLKDKVALVTGAGSGFGEGIAELFAREGARIVVVDLNADGGRRVAETINAEAPDRAVFVEADVADGSDSARMVRTATDAFGGLDVLVNNAGISHDNKPVLEIGEDEFDRVFAVNVKAIFHAVRHAVPALAARGGGSIINTASTAALRPRPGLAWYNASKGAVVVASKSLAGELAPQNIRVNALCPVLGDTPLAATFMGGDSPERRAQFVATIPLGRMSSAADVAGAALYLASDEAAFITGVALEIDGGRCA
ncbi:MAG: glucose 1-dehydrogenase [Inquilinus sp.]|nr:glucose 1-dehydrogenase [Inquilinus sp.]